MSCRNCSEFERSPHHRSILDPNSAEEAVCDVVPRVVVSVDHCGKVVDESTQRRGVDGDSAVELPTPRGRHAADRDNDLATVADLGLVAYFGGRVRNRVNSCHVLGLRRAGPRQCEVVTNYLGDVVQARMPAEPVMVGTVLSTALGGGPHRAQKSVQHALRCIPFRVARTRVIDQSPQPGHTDSGVGGHEPQNIASTTSSGGYSELVAIRPQR